MNAQNTEPKEGEKLETPEEKKKSLSRYLLEILLIVTIALAFRHYIASPTVVQGTSMLPTLRPWDFLISNKWALREGELERGMIVILDPPHGDGREFIKRVIGLPGDTVRIERGIVYINGEELDEPYTGGVPTYVPDNLMEVTVPPGQYFVMGDNRAYQQSNDSRSFGPISFSAMKGIATYRYFPFGEPFGPIGSVYEEYKKF